MLGLHDPLEMLIKFIVHDFDSGSNYADSIGSMIIADAIAVCD